MPHRRHIYAKLSDMEKSTMCAYPQSDHSLPHWKCVLQYCAKCPYINLPDQETYNQYSDITPSIQSHNYHIIACCTDSGIITLKSKKICCIGKQEYSSDGSTKNTLKVLVMIKTTISNFRTSFYIPVDIFLRLTVAGIGFFLQFK